MEKLTAAKKKALRAEGIIMGMVSIKSRVRGLDISNRDKDTVVRAIEADIARMEAHTKSNN